MNSASSARVSGVEPLVDGQSGAAPGVGSVHGEGRTSVAGHGAKLNGGGGGSRKEGGIELVPSGEAGRVALRTSAAIGVSDLDAVVSFGDVDDLTRTDGRKEAVRRKETSKLEPFNFNEGGEGKERGFIKQLLLQCVRQHGAHLAGYGELDSLLGTVLADYLQNLLERLWQRMRKPTVKTLRDKFRSLCRERKAADTANKLASGIVEEVSETDLLLNELMLEAKEAEERKKRERLEGDDREEALVSAGEEIREAASSRMAKRTVSTVGVEEGTCSGSTSNKRARCEEDSMEAWQKMVMSELDSRREREEKRLALRAEELELKKQRYRDDKEEREQRKREQSAQLQLLNALINKLT